MKKIFILLATILLLASCSSSKKNNSSNSNSATTKTISGKVSDPGVSGAKVDLLDGSGSIANFCGANSNTICNVWTSSDGIFNLVVPNSQDLSGYVLKTTGGTDTEYGFTLDYSLYANLSDQDIESVLVTPITTLVTFSSASKVAEVLGIDESELYDDPEENGNIAKYSYIISSIATSVGTEEAVSSIAEAMNSASSLEDVVTSVISDATTQESLLALIDRVESISSSDASSVIETIKQVERLNMFITALNDLGIEVSLSDDNVENNITILISYIEAQTSATVPVDEFIIDQLVRFLVALGTTITSTETTSEGFALADTYSLGASEFQSIIESTLVTADDETDIWVRIASLLSEDRVYSTEVALSEALGTGYSSNQARVDYYFNSTADINYKARSLTNIVLDDNITSSIYSSIIENYASYGLFDKANKIAQVYIPGTFARIKALASISRHGAKYYESDPSVRNYVDEAYNLLTTYTETMKNTISSSSISNDYVELYANLVSAYAPLKDTDSINSVVNDFNEVIKLYDQNKASSDTATATVYARFFNRIAAATTSSSSTVVSELVEAGELETALDMLDIRLELINGYPNAFSSNSDNARTVELVALQQQANWLATIYEADETGAYTDTIKTLVKNLANSIIDLIKYSLNNNEEYDPDDKTGNSMKYYYMAILANTVEALVTVAGDDEAAFELAEELYAYANPDNSIYTDVESFGNNDTYSPSKYQANVAAGMFKGLAYKYDFESAITEFQKRVEYFEDNYSRTLDPYLNKLVGRGGNAKYQGFFYSAIDTSSQEDAIKAVDWMYGKLKDALYEDEENNDFNSTGMSAIGGSFVSYSATLTSTSTISSMNIKYYPDGFTAIAKAYLRAYEVTGEDTYKDKALEALEYAEKYLVASGIGDSIAKYDYYMALSYWANQAGKTTSNNGYYTTARNVSLSSGEATDYALLYVLRAHDANYQQASNRTTTIPEDLTTAVSYLTSASDDDEKANAVTYYTQIANEYYDAGFTSNATSTISSAESVATTISADNTRYSSWGDIIEVYGTMELVDEGYAKILSLNFDEYNKNSLVQTLVNYLVGKDDFSNSDYATIDTDKDGKPDFIYPWVTEAEYNASGLQIDDDIDGDGISDDEDLYPYLVNN